MLKRVIIFALLLSSISIYASEKTMLFTPFADTEIEYIQSSSLTVDSCQPFYQESAGLIRQSTSIHVNSAGEKTQKSSDTSPNLINTYISIKSLDDFQNFDQFRAFLKAVDRGDLRFFDGTASVEVFYNFGDPLKETLRIDEEFLYMPISHGKALQPREGSTFYIVVQETNPTKGMNKASISSVFSVLVEESRNRANKTFFSYPRKTLRLSETNHIALKRNGRVRREPCLLRQVYLVKDLKIRHSIDYAPYEGYVSRLEEMMLDVRGDSEINTELDAFVAVLQNLTENPRDHESMPYYLPPVIIRNEQGGTLNYPLSQVINKKFNLINRWDNYAYTGSSSWDNYASTGSLNQPPSIRYGKALVSQIENHNDWLFTPTPDQEGNIRKGLLRQMEFQENYSSFQQRGDNIFVGMSIVTLPDDLSELMEHFTEEQQAQLLDENTGLKPLPYKIHTDYSMVIGDKVYYFNNTDNDLRWMR
ncbi:hypothetical protein SAMN05192551_10342 [Tindallia magadiensis]|uniref:Uncharacterized protein n=1 Tax=Tindallia magadiensis TaxID=69895 RepID=A0A1I3CVY4_9FIRM|nr:hypothetical protein [Tindallia magadiensis]SFH78603.1 hypothetical protein SAMN05192551_10342 [Tindallia magadiensis]